MLNQKPHKRNSESSEFIGLEISLVLDAAERVVTSFVTCKVASSSNSRQTKAFPDRLMRSFRCQYVVLEAE